MAKKFKFYSKEDIELIKLYANNGKKSKQNIVELTKKLKRPLTSIQQKYYSIKKELGHPPVRGSKALPNNVKLIPEGMKLELQATRITLEENKLVVYF